MTRRGRGGRRSKYGAEPIVIDGVRFASKAEGRRYRELRLLEKAGQLRELTLQPVFSLTVHGVAIGSYRGDFRFSERVDGHWLPVVEDVKGCDTPLSRWKRKHVLAEHGVEVRIVR